MPESPEVNLAPIIEEAKKIAQVNGAKGDMQVKEEPVAFGLKAVLIMAMYKVGEASFDTIAEEMAKIKHVQSAEVARMDLALG